MTATEPSDFDLFWDAYPKKQAKRDAEKAWKQTENERPPLPVILAKIAEFRRSRQWTRDNGDFIPLPASWLRAWRWDDEVNVPVTPRQRFERDLLALYNTGQISADAYREFAAELGRAHYEDECVAIMVRANAKGNR